MRLRCPVCGMSILWEEAWCSRTCGGSTHYFCCRGCAELFDERSVRLPAASGHRARFPQVGALTLDEFEAALWDAWPAGRAPGVCSSIARALERCILSLIVGSRHRRHEVERLLAAELVRLRDPALDADATLGALRRLPQGIEAAARAAALPSARASSLCHLAEDLAVQIQAWSGGAHPAAADEESHRKRDAAGGRCGELASRVEKLSPGATT